MIRATRETISICSCGCRSSSTAHSRGAGAGIQNILFGVSARDPLTYGVVVALITLVSLVATLVAARRATRVDPMIALREE